MLDLSGETHWRPPAGTLTSFSPYSALLPPAASVTPGSRGLILEDRLDSHPVSAHRPAPALYRSHRMAISMPAVRFEQELSQASRIRGVVPSDAAPLGNAVMFTSVTSP